MRVELTETNYLQGYIGGDIYDDDDDDAVIRFTSQDCVGD